jgi:hypothetical protein
MQGGITEGDWVTREKEKKVALKEPERRVQSR